MKKETGKLVNSFYYPTGKLPHKGGVATEEDKSRIIDAVALAVANKSTLVTAVQNQGITMRTYYAWKRALEER